VSAAATGWPARAQARGLSWPWTYKREGTRDLRFDLVRGLCVFGMICNHIGSNSWARIFSLHDGLLITPAEGFVFISGFIFGMVYSSYIQKNGQLAAVEKAFKRCLTIYLLSVVLSFVFGGVMYLNGVTDGLGPVTSVPRFILDIITLHQVVFMVDVLTMYTFLIALGAFAIWLISRGHTVWVLAPSLALWSAYQVDPEWADTIPWPIQHNVMFHIAAWQMPFLVALCLGYHRNVVLAWLHRWQQLLFPGATAVMAALVYLTLTQSQHFEWLAGLSQKPAEGPLRLVACLFVFQLAQLLMTYFWRPIYAAVGWLLMPLGQNSLYAYTMHLLVMAAVWQLTQAYQDSEPVNTAVQLGAVLLVWGLTKKRVLFKIIPR